MNMHGSHVPAGRLCRSQAQTLGRHDCEPDRASALTAPQPSRGFENDSWDLSAIGWMGGEP
jgi:hypothetical protein